MNLSQVKGYANETAALLEQVDGVQGAVQQLTALLRAASEQGNYQQQLQITEQRRQAEAQLAAWTKTLLEQTKAADVEAARTLLVDVTVRIEQAMEEHRKARALIAQFEFAVSQNEFAPEPAEGEAPTGFTRLMAEIELEKAKGRAEARVKAASDLVPSRAVVLL